jgi:hypothetical protein
MADEQQRNTAADSLFQSYGYGGVSHAPYDLNVQNQSADQVTNHLLQAWKPELYGTGSEVGQNLE